MRIGPDHGQEIRQLGAVLPNERVARVVPLRDGGEHDSRSRPDRQVLERVHGNVNLATEQARPQRADEHAGAADLR